MPHFPRNIVCPCRCYTKPTCTSSIQLPRTLRFFSSATSPLPPPSPSKFTRRRLKVASAVTLSSILAGLYYNYTTNNSSSTSLNTTTFTPYTLTSKTPITSGPTQTTIFTLSPPSRSSAPPPPKLPLSAGILSIQIKQPQLQIARSYTPLPPCQNAELRFLIKREPGGEMSRYLYSLKEGDVVEIRGPGVEYAYPPQGNNKIVFFAGGTGIAPALQMAESLLLQEGEGSGREVEILWAVRHKEEAFGAMKGEVDSLTKRVEAAGSGRKLVVRRFVDSEGGIGIRDVEAAIATKGKKASVLVSGPEGFIAWIAGPKDLSGGREEQGVLGGLLKSVARKKGCNIEVLKL